MSPIDLANDSCASESKLTGISSISLWEPHSILKTEVGALFLLNMN